MELLRFQVTDKIDSMFRFVLPLLVFFVVFARCEAAMADDANIIPSFTVKEEYSDNIFFTTLTPTSAFATVFSPAIEFMDRTENTNASITARMDGFLYNDDQGLVTAINHSYRGDFRVKPNPRFDVGTGLSYRVNNRPDKATDLNGAAVNAVRRDFQSYSVDAGYDLSELTSGRLSYSYEQEDYTAQALPTAQTLSNTRAHTAGLRITHDLGRWIPLAKGILDLSAAHYTFNRSQTDNISASLGVSWAFTEKISATALVGGRYTRSTFDVTMVSPVFPLMTSQGNESNSDSGWVGQLMMAKTGEVANGSLSLTRNVAISSGRNGAAESTMVNAVLNYNLSPELASSFSMGYQWDRSTSQQFESQTINQDYFRYSMGIHYAMRKDFAFRDLSFDASYSFAKAMYKESNIEASRNVVFLGITYRYPIFER